MGAALSQQEALSDSSSAGDESERLVVPHKFDEIIAQGTTATADELEDQMYGSGIYLAGKTKKYWIDEKTRCNCFMLFPRALSITHSESKEYWRWHPLEETSGTVVEVATLLDVCWLEIHGRLELSHLTPGVDYDVVFEVKLTKQARGWYTPMNLWIMFPDGTVQQRKEKLQGKPKDQWMELKAGQFKTHVGQNGELDMALFQYHVGNWKSGLTIKGIKIVPTE